MKIVLKSFLLVLVLLMNCQARADSINLKPASDADCKAISGVWRGYFVDQTSLFGNGGPWPIELRLGLQNGRIVGTANGSKAPDYVRDKVTANLSGVCSNGMITDVTLVKAGKIGNKAAPGIMVNNRMLILHLVYSNAMTGTEFTVFATKN